MSSVFPRNGLAPGVNNSGVPLAVAPAEGCAARYYNEQCAQKVDPTALNALISELVSVVNACPSTRWDCSRYDNLLRALTCIPQRRSFFYAKDSGGQTAVPNNVDTRMTHLTTLVDSSLADGSIVASNKFTCGDEDAGFWLFLGFGGMELLTDPAVGYDIRAAIAKNGGTGPFRSGVATLSTTYGIEVVQPYVVNVGDEIDVYMFQNTGASRNVKSLEFVGMRIGDLP